MENKLFLITLKKGYSCILYCLYKRKVFAFDSSKDSRVVFFFVAIATTYDVFFLRGLLGLRGGA